jgi:hypothetical protein
MLLVVKVQLVELVMEELLILVVVEVVDTMLHLQQLE